MNNFVILFAAITMTVNVYTQGTNWEIIPLPQKSTVDIIAQSPDGLLLGKNTNDLGNVVSFDAGYSWSYLNNKTGIYIGQIFSLGFNKDLLVYRFPSIYKFDLLTGNVDTNKLALNLSVKSLYSTNFSFGLALTTDNRLIKLYRDSTLFLPYTGAVKWVGTSAFSDKVYAIINYSNKNYIYRINENGTWNSLRQFPDNPGMLFLHKNTIIRNTTYSNDEGLTWNQYNLPFSDPDAITTYMGNLAFVKESKLYYKEDNQSIFNVLNLPPGVSSKDILLGQFIVIPFKAEHIEKPKILREPNGTFVPVEFNLETYITYNILPLKNGGLIVDNENHELYYQKENSGIWNSCNQNVSNRVYWAERSNLSVNQNGVVSVISKDGKLFLSKDGGSTWINHPEFDNLRYILKQELQNGTYIISDSLVFLKPPDSESWILENTRTINRDMGFISNANVIYTELYGAEIVFSYNLVKNNYFRIVDIPSYSYSLFPHYEMNYMFNYYSQKSYDNGATFDNVDPILPQGMPYFRPFPMRTGHFLLLGINKAYISTDYCKTWQDLKLGLENDDRIRSFGLSQDNYLYINTTKHGVLRNKFPLPQANIVRIKMVQDFLSDCQTENDTEPIEGIRLSMGNDIHQISNHEGRVSFYTFEKSADISIDKKSDIYDFCRDTIHVEFENLSGSVDSMVISGAVLKKCPQISVKFDLNHDSLNQSYYNVYKFIIQNHGNDTSKPSRAIFTFDPNLFDIKNVFTPDTLIQIDEWSYALKIDTIQPGEVRTYTIYHRLNPRVRSDYEICSTFSFESNDIQCKPVASKSVCKYVNKDGRDKTITIKFFEDINNNCLKDPDEKYILENINICADTNDLIIHNDSVMYYTTKKDTVHLAPIYNNDLYVLCQDEYVFPLQNNVYNYNLDIPVKEIKKCAILSGSFASSRLIRCFDNKLSFYIHNQGNIPSFNGYVKISIDEFFEITNVYPTPKQVDGNIYYFDFNPVNPNGFEKFDFECKLICDAMLQQTHCNKIEIFENNPACNLNKPISEYCSTNNGSYDPNDKAIFVSGIENESIITGDDLIEYRIRFQNTGTDTAYHIKIHDPLSNKFDVASLRLIHATHACSWKVDNRVLIVDFPNINLVDSFTNVLGSQGEIRFSLRLASDPKVGDLIANQAYIFFDFNEPVSTNKVINKYGLVSQIKDIIYDKPLKLDFVPNPTESEVRIKGLSTTIDSEIFIFNHLGQLINSGYLKNGNDRLQTHSLPAGIYQVIAKEGTLIKAGRIVKVQNN